MFSIPVDELLHKLPAGKLRQAVDAFLAPMANLLPDRRLRRVVSLAGKAS